MQIDIFNFLKDSSLVILAWFFMAISFFTWGQVFSKLLTIKISGSKGIIANIWLGWVFGIFIFAIYNLFFPINAFASSLFYFSGIIVFFIKYLKKALLFLKTIEPLKLVLIILMIIITSFVAIQLPMNYDTGLYHLSSIRWANEYHIIKGLGNLHTRLGFNQLYFLYCASLSFHPYLSAYGFHLANTFLFILFVISLVLSGKTIDYLFICLFFFLPMPYFWITSPTTDIASSLLQIIAFRYFIEIIYYNNNHKERSKFIAFSAILSAILITIKLSNIVFAIGLGLITIIFGKKHGFDLYEKKIIGKAFIFIGLLFGLWIIRGYIQTGYPFFPSSIGKINFEWTVPQRLAKYTENYVYAGSRTDGLITNIDSPVLQNWNWLEPWFKESFFDKDKHLNNDLIMDITTIFLLVFFPMTMYSWGMGSLTLFVLSIIMLFIWLINVIKNKELFGKTNFLSYLIVMELAAIAFWFFVAPEVRFANSIFILLFTTSLLMIKESYTKLVINNKVKKAMMFYPVIILIWCFYNNYSEEEFRIGGMIKINKIYLNDYVTKSGLILKVPPNHYKQGKEKCDQTWDSALLATPEPEPGLTLIGSSIDEGFCIKE